MGLGFKLGAGYDVTFGSPRGGFLQGGCNVKIAIALFFLDRNGVEVEMGVVLLHFHLALIQLEPDGGIDLLHFFVFGRGVAIGIHNALDAEGFQVGIVAKVAAVSDIRNPLQPPRGEAC